MNYVLEFWKENAIGIGITIGCIAIALFGVSFLHNEEHRKKFTKLFAKRKSKPIIETPMNAYSPLRNAKYVDALNDIRINDSGFSEDRWLTKAQVVKILEHRWAIKTKQEKGRIRLLGFSDIIIPSRLAKDCNRTIELLQAIEALPIRIDWVLSEKMTKECFRSYTEQLHIQCHTIYRPHAYVPMGRYDMVLHPYSGLDSSYEILVRFIKQLQEDMQ